MSKLVACAKGEDCSNKNEEANCTLPSIEDKLPVQCVDSWAEDKFSYLDRYLSASWGARQKFVQLNNAVYIDLFAGPGRCRIKGDRKEIVGGAVRVANITKGPFNRIILNDISAENCDALKKRVPSAEIHNQDANVIITTIVEDLLQAPYEKYHFAFIDPFSTKHLKFHVLESLAKLKRIDIMLNFPIGPIRRNWQKWVASKRGNVLDEFLGTDHWREKVQETSEAVFTITMLDVLYEQLKRIGFPEEGLGLINEAGEDNFGNAIATIKNSMNVPLYYLVLASKHKLAANLWQSITKTNAKGQKSLF